MTFQNEPIFLHQLREEENSRKKRRLMPTNMTVIGPGLLQDAEWSRVDTSRLKHADELKEVSVRLSWRLLDIARMTVSQ